MKLKTILIAGAVLAAALFVGGYTTYIAIEHHTRQEITQAERQRLITENSIEMQHLRAQAAQAVMDEADGKISTEAAGSIMQDLDRKTQELLKENQRLRSQKP